MGADIEKEKLELEKRRLEFEIEKHRDFIKSERIKNAAIFIPLVLVILSFLINDYNSNKEYLSELNLKMIEANNAFKLKEMEINNSFKLKAAEIVMATESINGSYSRAIALKRMFPEYLDDSFAEGFDPKTIGTPAKMNLAELIIEHPSQRNDIIDFWISSYPPDAEWANEWRVPGIRPSSGSSSSKRSSSQSTIYAAPPERG